MSPRGDESGCPPGGTFRRLAGDRGPGYPLRTHSGRTPRPRRHRRRPVRPAAGPVDWRPPPMSELISPDWADPLPPFVEAHVADLEARLDEVVRRLERARGRVRKVR